MYMPINHTRESLAVLSFGDPFYGGMQYGGTYLFRRFAVWRYVFGGKRYLVFRRYILGNMAVFFLREAVLVFVAVPRITAGIRLVPGPPIVGGKIRRENSRRINDQHYVSGA